MFYVNRMIQRFPARQEIPTAAVRPRNDIYGGAVRDSTININLPPLRLHAARQPSPAVIARSRPYGGDVAISTSAVNYTTAPINIEYPKCSM